MSKQSNQKISSLPDPLLECAPTVDRSTLDEISFRRVIAVERKRTERSQVHFLLMLVEIDSDSSPARQVKSLQSILESLHTCTRDTDVVGWYKEQVALGVIFTSLEADSRASILNTILKRVSTGLKDNLSDEEFSQVKLSFHFSQMSGIAIATAGQAIRHSIRIWRRWKRTSVGCW